MPEMQPERPKPQVREKVIRRGPSPVERKKAPRKQASPAGDFVPPTSDTQDNGPPPPPPPPPPGETTIVYRWVSEQGLIRVWGRARETRSRALYGLGGLIVVAGIMFVIALAANNQSVSAGAGGVAAAAGMAVVTYLAKAVGVTADEIGSLIRRSQPAASSASGEPFDRTKLLVADRIRTADSLESLGQPDAALSVFEMAANDLGGADAHNEAAQALYRRGDREQAITHYQEAVDAAARDDDAKPALNAAYALGRIEAASPTERPWDGGARFGAPARDDVA